MFGDIDCPLKASCGFVRISWASCMFWHFGLKCLFWTKFCHFGGSRFTIHRDACSFHASMLRPASQAGPMHEPAWVRQVSWCCTALINEACVSVCRATLLSSELVGLACVQAWSSNLRGRAYRPNKKVSGEDGILSDVVPVYFCCPAF